jgi:hypothetical protein
LLYECKDSRPTPEEYATYLRYLNYAEAVLDHAFTGREDADAKPWIESELQQPKTSDDEPETSDKVSDMGEDESRNGEADSDMRDDELQTIADDFETSGILVHVFKFIEKEFFARHPNRRSTRL